MEWLIKIKNLNTLFQLNFQAQDCLMIWHLAKIIRSLMTYLFSGIRICLRKEFMQQDCMTYPQDLQLFQDMATQRILNGLKLIQLMCFIGIMHMRSVMN